MGRENQLSDLDIAEELGTGKSFVKFLLKRFKKWLPHELVDGRPRYSSAIIKTLAIIQEKLEAGTLPSEIEDYLDRFSNFHADDTLGSSINLSQNEDIRLNKGGMAFLKSLFNELGDHQQQIAAAHEKRAEAEQRKALAIEKRAEAEEKKALAMNNIANALQEMNRLRGSVEPAAQQIAHQAAKTVILDEDFQTDDLGLLIDTKQKPEAPLDDLFLLVQPDDPVMDDLSSLIDMPAEATFHPALDNLFLLIEDSFSQQMDDLSKLIDPVDVSGPVVPEEADAEHQQTIEIGISPEDDLEQYKAAVMNVILELKAKDLNAAETTRVLNRNNIRTLSGKPEWSRKAIEQIYKFISSAT